MRRTLVLLSTMVVALSLAGGLALVAVSPAARAADGDCQPSGSEVVCTFNYTGNAQSWTVPEGVTQATFEVFGAQGGGEPRGQAGGLGGKASATIAVTPGNTLQINVGGAGSSGVGGGAGGAGGFNGGAAGGNGCFSGPGGGGGASDVRSGNFGLADRMIVGGGGGGAGGFFGGVGGFGGGSQGGPGATGRPSSEAQGGGGGGGGTNTEGGAGGVGQRAGVDGEDGGTGTGGSGGGANCASFADDAGGGGGGGYFGGGGGGGGFSGGGGGGGSGFGPSGVVFSDGGVRSGNGLVTITYTPPDTTPPDTTPPTLTVTHTADGSNGWNKTSPVTLNVSASDSGSGLAGDPTCTDGTTDLPLTAGSTAGTWTASVSGEGTHIVECTVSDQADNQSTASDTVKIDTTAPTVTSTFPRNGGEVGPAANIRATFSEEMQEASVLNAFKLFKKGSTNQIAAQVSYDAATDTATLNPTNNLRRGVTYKAVVTTVAKDVAGNRLDQNSSAAGLQQKVWFFEID